MEFLVSYLICAFSVYIFQAELIVDCHKMFLEQKLKWYILYVISFKAFAKAVNKDTLI